MSRLTEKINEFDYKLIKYNDIVRANARQKLGQLEDLEEQLDCPLEAVIEHINESYKALCQHIEINEKYIELKKYRDIVELSKISYDIALSKEQKGLCEKYFTWLKKDKSE